MIFIIVCENTVIVFSLAEVNFQARTITSTVAFHTAERRITSPPFLPSDDQVVRLHTGSVFGSPTTITTFFV